MKTKDVLSEIVSELEKTGALVSALQDRLISKGLLTQEEIAETYPKMRKAYLSRLAMLQIAISELPE